MSDLKAESVYTIHLCATCSCGQQREEELFITRTQAAGPQKTALTRKFRADGWFFDKETDEPTCPDCVQRILGGPREA